METKDSMRILLRNEAGLYLQPSGEWSDKRETDRQFQDSFTAYFWAREQKLLRSFVVLAFPDQTLDLSIRAVSP